MERTSQGELVASSFPIREEIALSTTGPHPFGSFPKHAFWLMLSIGAVAMRALAKVRIAEVGLDSSGMVQPVQEKLNPTLVIPKPVLSARTLLAADSETADSSRDKTALQNDNSFGVFRSQQSRRRAEIEKRESK